MTKCFVCNSSSTETILDLGKSPVANNLELDNGIGTCGKEGQMVPVGVGQPSLKIKNLTVSGTL